MDEKTNVDFDFKKTILSEDYRDYHLPDAPMVMYVGFDADKSYLEIVTNLAGFRFGGVLKSASDANRFLEQKFDKTINLAHCIVNDSYSYIDDLIPASDGPFCNFDTFEKHETFDQGALLVTELVDLYPSIKFAICNTHYFGLVPEILKHPQVTSIYESNSNSSIPFVIMEYLRNKNTDLFEVEK